MSDFNLDASDDSGYKPVTITYREKEYTLGSDAYGLMMAPGVLGEVKDLTPEQVGARLVKKLPELLGFLCPDLAEALKENTASIGEQIVLIRALTEVLNRLGRFRFTPDA